MEFVISSTLPLRHLTVMGLPIHIALPPRVACPIVQHNVNWSDLKQEPNFSQPPETEFNRHLWETVRISHFMCLK